MPSGGSGTGGGGALPITPVIGFGLKLVGPMLTLVYPLYSSFEALESQNVKETRQWLTYWVLYSVITIFEFVAAPVLKWIPLYNTAKLLLVAWLVLPQFKGAEYVYANLVRPNALHLRDRFKERVVDKPLADIQSSTEQMKRAQNDPSSAAHHKSWMPSGLKVAD
eukprot:jgi/Mesen1/6554/ME000334S05892